MDRAALAAAKKELRKALLPAMRSVPADVRAAESASLAKHLFSFIHSLQLPSPLTIAMFLSLSSEIDMHPAMLMAWEQGHRVLVPYVLAAPNAHGDRMLMVQIHGIADLEQNFPPARLNVRELRATELEAAASTGRAVVDSTTASREIDLLVVPGLAFDSTGRRLGRGAGYYDQFIATSRSFGPLRTAAVAYTQQLPQSLTGVESWWPEGFEQVPTDDKDQPVDLILTPKGIVLGNANDGRTP